MNKKLIYVIVLLVIVIFVGAYFYQNNAYYEEALPITDLSQQDLPENCIDHSSDPEVLLDVPTITSLSDYYLSVGDKVTLTGCDFVGFEGDRNVWIKNQKGETGLLFGDRFVDTDTSLTVTLESPICQSNNSYSGLPCDSWFDLEPGTYILYVQPWVDESNKVLINIE